LTAILFRVSLLTEPMLFLKRSRPNYQGFQLGKKFYPEYHITNRRISAKFEKLRG
jgi:hypothetical protein